MSSTDRGRRGAGCADCLLDRAVADFAIGIRGDFPPAVARAAHGAETVAAIMGLP